jgi:MSHA pilin protein MshD
VATLEVIGPEASDTTRALFDNVNDYHGFTMLAGIQDILGNPVPGLTAYKVTNVTVATAGGTFGLADVNDALLITVTVTGPANVSVTLQGYRFRYAPNSP